MKTGSVSANRPSVTSNTWPSAIRASRSRRSGLRARLAGCSAGCDHASQAESGDQASPVTTPLSDAAICAHLAGLDVDEPQPPVLRRDGDRLAVGRRRQPGDAANLAGRDPPRVGGRIGGTGRVAGADLQGVAAIGVGRPDDLSAGPEYLRETRPDAGNNRDGPGRPVPVGQPVHGSANLDRAGPPAMVDRQRADMLLGRDKARCPAAHRRAEGDVEPDRPGCLQVIEQPQLAAARVDDPAPVSAGLPRVPAVVIGVPPQVASV